MSQDGQLMSTISFHTLTPLCFINLEHPHISYSQSRMKYTFRDSTISGNVSNLLD